MGPEGNREAEMQVQAEVALARSGGDVHVLDVLIVLAKNKNMIAKGTMIGAVLAILISLLMPNIYVATARLLPPLPNSSSMSVMLGQLGSLTSLMAGAGGGNLTLRNPNDTYLAILRSRTVSDGVVARCRLQERYGTRTLTEARVRLEKLSTFTTDKEGVIIIEVEDRNPKVAAEIANAFVSEMARVTSTLNITEAGQRRVFFEGELVKAHEKLARAEAELKAVQERLGLVELGTQARAAIGAGADLHAKIGATEVELQVARTYATESNPRVVELRQRLAALRGQLAILERGNEKGSGLGKLPASALEYGNKLREVKFNEEIIGVLVRQYEAARIDEANNLSVIQVLDSAMEPEQKARPFRALIVAVVTMLSFFFSCLWVFIVEGRRRARLVPEDEARLALLRKYLKWEHAGLAFWRQQ